MRKCGFKPALLLVSLAGLSSPAFAWPPVEQRSAVGQGAEVLDPSDYSLRGASNSYAGNPVTLPEVSASGGTASAGATSSSQWEMVKQLQQMQEELQNLRGMVEQQGYELNRLKKQQRDQYLDLDSRISRGSSGSPGATDTQSPPVFQEASLPAGGGQDNASEAQAYEAAYAYVKAKQFDQAIIAFENVLAQFPNGKLTPNCHYWLGDLYYEKTPKDYEKAESHFQYLLKNYSTHAKVPDALFKLGKMSREKGDTARAKRFFDRLVQSYPDSDAVSHALPLMR